MVVRLLLAVLVTVAPVASALAGPPAPTPEGAGFAHARDQGVLYLQKGRLAEARRELERALALPGGAADPGTVSAAVGLYRTLGEIEAALRVLDAARQETGLGRLVAEFGRFYGKVVFQAPGGGTCRMRVAVQPDSPLIGVEKKQLFTAVTESLGGRVLAVLPQERFLPAGRYVANGVPFEVKAGLQPVAVTPPLHRVLVAAEGPPDRDAVLTEAIGRTVGGLVEVVDAASDDPVKGLGRILVWEPDAVVAVGAGATRAVRERAPDVPVVFVGVPDWRTWGLVHTGNPVAGVDSVPPPEALLGLLRKVAPGVRRVGVVTFGEESAEAVAAARAVASRLGFVLVTVEADRPELLGRALAALAPKRPEVLWLAPDPALWGGANVERAVRWAAALRIPVVAHDDAAVDRGALLGVTVGPSEVGAAAGLLVRRIVWEGRRAEEVGVVQAEGYSYSVNLGTAAALGLVLPEDFLHGAARKVGGT